jgi:diguanylate cyclase (GGDEF)-like protein
VDGRADIARIIAAHRPSVVRDWARASGIDPELADEIVGAIASAVGDGSPVAAPSVPIGDPVISRLATLRALLVQLVVDEVPSWTVDGVTLVTGAVDDLLQRARDEERAVLEQAAFTDALTGAGNRRALEREFPQIVSAASRRGETVSLVLIDLDGLKAINDRDGHAAGDQALVRLAAGLEGAARGADTHYRLGGDEFVLLLPGTDAPVAERVLDRLATTLPAFSYGLAATTTDGRTLDELIARADDRLIAAKVTKGQRRAAAARPIAPAPNRVPSVGVASVGVGALVALVAAASGSLDRITPAEAIRVLAGALAAGFVLWLTSGLARTSLPRRLAIGALLALGVGVGVAVLAPHRSSSNDLALHGSTSTTARSGAARTISPVTKVPVQATPAPAAPALLAPAAATAPAVAAPRRRATSLTVPSLTVPSRPAISAPAPAAAPLAAPVQAVVPAPPSSVPTGGAAAADPPTTGGSTGTVVCRCTLRAQRVERGEGTERWRARGRLSKPRKPRSVTAAVKIAPAGPGIAVVSISVPPPVAAPTLAAPSPAPVASGTDTAVATITPGAETTVVLTAPIEVTAAAPSPVPDPPAGPSASATLTTAGTDITLTVTCVVVDPATTTEPTTTEPAAPAPS